MLLSIHFTVNNKMKIRAIMSPSKADEQLGIDLHNPLTESMCFPGDTRVKSLPANVGDKFNLWIWKIPWRRKWQPTLVFLPGESHGQWSLASYSLQFHKEPDMTEETACTRLIKMFITFCFKTLLSINIYFKMILKNQRFSLYI